MFITLLGLGIVAGVLSKREQEFPSSDQIDDNKAEVRSVFKSLHEYYPNGADELRIFGAGYPNIASFPSWGNPEPRNPMNSLFTYPQKKASSQINKDDINWMNVGVINKKNQLQLIEEKINEDDHLLLQPHYKQLNGSTVSHYPKINLKYYSLEKQRTF